MTPARPALCAFVVALLLATVPAPPANALSPGQSGVIHFDSVNVNGFGALIRRRYDPKPVPVFGTLLLPGDLRAKVPAMVVAHGSGGVSQSRDFEWAAELNSMGIAAFIVDSFTPRGITETATGTTPLHVANNIADVLKALELLSTHPNIDAGRIGIMGASLGGRVAHTTIYEEVRAGIIGSDLRFAVHIPFYPNCNSRYITPNRSAVPELLLLAELDDYTPAAPCVDFAQSLAASGADVTSIVYPGAHHGFDAGSALQWVPDVVTARNCADETRLDTFARRRYDTGEVFASLAAFQSYLAACQTRGASVGTGPAAEAQARIDLRIFLARVFGLDGVSLPASQPDRIFNWLQDAFPQYLQPRGTESRYAAGYYYRCYLDTPACIGIKDGKVYYYVPAIDPTTIFEAGSEAALLALAQQAGY